MSENGVEAEAEVDNEAFISIKQILMILKKIKASNTISNDISNISIEDIRQLVIEVLDEQLRDKKRTRELDYV